MRYQLIFRSPDGEDVAGLDSRLVVGRDQETCDVAFVSERLSRQHAEFVVTADGVLVRDLGSKNGVLVNGSPVTETLVRPGDRVLLGDIVVTLQARGTSSTSEIPGAAGAPSSFPPVATIPAPDLDRTIRLPRPVPGPDQPVRPAAPEPPAADLDRTIRLPRAAPVPDQPIRPAAPEPPAAEPDRTIRLPRAAPGPDLPVRPAAPEPPAADLDRTIRLPRAAPGPDLPVRPAAPEPPAAELDRTMRLPTSASVSESGSTSPSGPVAVDPTSAAARPVETSGQPGEPATWTSTSTPRPSAEVDAGEPRFPARRGAFGMALVAACLAVSALTFFATVAVLHLAPGREGTSVWMTSLPGALVGLLVSLVLALMLRRSLAGRLARFAQDVKAAADGRGGPLEERYGLPAIGSVIACVNEVLERSPRGSGAEASETPGSGPSRSGASAGSERR